MNDQTEKNGDNDAGSTSVPGLLSCVLICATIAFVAYIVLPGAPPEPTRRLWVPVVIETNGHQTILGETRQMEFWTPSVKTKDFLRKEHGDFDRTEKWQVLPSDDTVAQFGMVLHSNANVLGYRRVEVWGQGRSAYKPGWWWTMNVLTNYSVGELAGIYRDYWKSPQPVLIEVIDNRGSTEK